MRQQMYDDVAAVTGVGHDIFSWLHIVQASVTTFESLSDSQSRLTLDVKLGSALRKLPKGDLKQQAQTRAKALEKQGRMLRGRQIFWLISQQYALDENRGALYVQHGRPDEHPLPRRCEDRSFLDALGEPSRGPARAPVRRQPRAPPLREDQEERVAIDADPQLRAPSTESPRQDVALPLVHHQDGGGPSAEGE